MPRSKSLKTDSPVAKPTKNKNQMTPGSTGKKAKRPKLEQDGNKSDESPEIKKRKYEKKKKLSSSKDEDETEFTVLKIKPLDQTPNSQMSTPSVTVVSPAKTEKKKRARMGADKTSDTPGSGKKSKPKISTLDKWIKKTDKENTANVSTEEPEEQQKEQTIIQTVEQTTITEVEKSKPDVVIGTKAPSKCLSLGSGPTTRWGHTWCMMSDAEAVLVGGQGGEKSAICKDSCWLYEIEKQKWKLLETTSDGVKPESRMGHTAVYDPTVRCIYIFGGSKNVKWYSDVHILDVDDWSWKLVKANGKAPTRSYHSATLYRHELWIFGGVYPRPDPQPDGSSNDIHVFSPLEECWYSPVVMGDKPCHRSGHSATLLQDRLVMFGGWDFPVCFSDLFILDMVLLEWTEPKYNGKAPSPRSWHGSTALSGNRVLIHGGYDGNLALSDSHIFNLDTLTWTEVKLEPEISARAGHTCLCLPYKHENEEKDEVIIFGGGDNDGAFFNDLLDVMIPFV